MALTSVPSAGAALIGDSGQPPALTLQVPVDLLPHPRREVPVSQSEGWVSGAFSDGERLLHEKCLGLRPGRVSVQPTPPPAGGMTLDFCLLQTREQHRRRRTATVTQLLPRGPESRTGWPKRAPHGPSSGRAVSSNKR